MKCMKITRLVDNERYGTAAEYNNRVCIFWKNVLAQNQKLLILKVDNPTKQEPVLQSIARKIIRQKDLQHKAFANKKDI